MESQSDEQQPANAPTLQPHLPADDVAGTPLTTFHFFSKLPLELQQLILSFCEPPGRAIEIRKKTHFRLSDPLEPYDGYSELYEYDSAVFATGSVPALLHTCRLTRTYALQHWYKHSYPNTLGRGSYPPGLTYFFNTNNDAILFTPDPEEGNHSLLYADLADLINFRFRDHILKFVLHHRHNDVPNFGSILIDFPNLEEIIMISPEANLSQSTRYLELGALEADDDAEFEWEDEYYTLQDLVNNAYERWGSGSSSSETRETDVVVRIRHLSLSSYILYQSWLIGDAL
jgi:hypothetical protein